MSIRLDNPKEDVFKSIQFMKSLRRNESEFNITASPEALMAAGVEDGAWYADKALIWLDGTIKPGNYSMDHVLKLAEIMQKEAHFAECLRHKQNFAITFKESALDIATALNNMEFK